MCKYQNIIGFPISQLIRRRKREKGKTLDISKTISAFDVMVYDFCLLLFNPGLKKQMVRFSRKLKTEAKLIQNCSAIRQGKSILSLSFFFFPNHNPSKEGFSFIKRYLPGSFLQRRRVCFVKPDAFYFSWNQDL